MQKIHQGVEYKRDEFEALKLPIAPCTGMERPEPYHIFTDRVQQVQLEGQQRYVVDLPGASYVQVYNSIPAWARPIQGFNREIDKLKAKGHNPIHFKECFDLIWPTAANSDYTSHSEGKFKREDSKVLREVSALPPEFVSTALLIFSQMLQVEREASKCPMTASLCSQTFKLGLIVSCLTDRQTEIAQDTPR